MRKNYIVCLNILHIQTTTKTEYVPPHILYIIHSLYTYKISAIFYIHTTKLIVKF